MGTINQPTPSNPGSPRPDQQPLQPGGPQVSRNTNDVYRSNPQSPDDHDSNNRDSGPEHQKK